MNWATLMSTIIQLLVGGISGIATGIGGGISTLVNSIFLTGTGETQTISAFGALVVIFAGVSLAMALCRWVVNFISSLGARNR